jgi:hypothetical protein
MITDIVPLTISATTMFVQVQSGELLVGGKSHALCGSLNRYGASTRTPAEQISVDLRQVPDTFPDSLLPHSAVVRLKRHKFKARRFVAAISKTKRFPRRKSGKLEHQSGG